MCIYVCELGWIIKRWCNALTERGKEKKWYRVSVDLHSRQHRMRTHFANAIGTCKFKRTSHFVWQQNFCNLFWDLSVLTVYCVCVCVCVCVCAVTHECGSAQIVQLLLKAFYVCFLKTLHLFTHLISDRWIRWCILQLMPFTCSESICYPVPIWSVGMCKATCFWHWVVSSLPRRLIEIIEITNLCQKHWQLTRLVLHSPKLNPTHFLTQRVVHLKN